MRYEVRFIRPDPDRDENMVIDLADADKVVGIRGSDIVILSPVAQGDPPVDNDECGFLYSHDGVQMRCGLALDADRSHDGPHLPHPSWPPGLFGFAAFDHDFPRPL